ncbi:type II secretion system protein GspG [Pontiella sp.]|uniref:type II secretion system protein GspG n=1 Tax=Pontiella sp. TaxID=2837462 RepID=UPI00356684E6
MAENQMVENGRSDHLCWALFNGSGVSGLGFRGRRRGFTLLELLAVLVVVAVLIGLGAKGYRFAQRQAKESCALAEIGIFGNALNEYRAEYGRYPEQTTADGVSALPELDELKRLAEGVVPVDPWGNEYQYVCTNRFLYRIWSKGQDAINAEDDISPFNPGN